jgi:hypothetical protein
MKVKGLKFTVLLLFTVCCIAPAFAGNYDEKEVITAAEEFVALIDLGLFSESWDEGDHLLQIRTSRPDWISNLTLNHSLFGWVIERRPKLTSYRGSLPGLPDGDYVIVVFESFFEKKRSAIETVIMVLDEEGEWRSTGYTLK